MRLMEHVSFGERRKHASSVVTGFSLQSKILLEGGAASATRRSPSPSCTRARLWALCFLASDSTTASAVLSSEETQSSFYRLAYIPQETPHLSTSGASTVGQNSCSIPWAALASQDRTLCACCWNELERIFTTESLAVYFARSLIPTGFLVSFCLWHASSRDF